MSEYNPDYWRILKIKIGADGKLHYRIIATWAGSYTWGSSWKISSGVEGFEDKGDYFESPQSSGSTYILYKNREGANGFLMNTFQYYREQFVNEYGEGNFTFELIELDDFLKEYNEL